MCLRYMGIKGGCFFLMLFLSFASGAAVAAVLTADFSISKVNFVDKQWIIPPDRRSFLGSQGIRKFDRGRPISADKRGENYVVSWAYSGKERIPEVILKFEFYNNKGYGYREYVYTDVKHGSHAWTYENVGEDFKIDGKVDRWKASLISVDGNILTEKRSATWTSLKTE